jgi:hypothetical protein
MEFVSIGDPAVKYLLKIAKSIFSHGGRKP